jgi:hypothetical protein
LLSALLAVLSIANLSKVNQHDVKTLPRSSIVMSITSMNQI